MTRSFDDPLASTELTLKKIKENMLPNRLFLLRLSYFFFQKAKVVFETVLFSQHAYQRSTEDTLHDSCGYMSLFNARIIHLSSYTVSLVSLWIKPNQNQEIH
jgi:uncharacterized membrane protein YbaN (DUF454 family)